MGPLHCFWLLSLPPPVLAHHSPVKMRQWFGGWGWHAGRVEGSLGFEAAPCTAQSGGWLLQTSLKLPLKLRCHISASLCVTGPQSGSSAQEMVQSLLGSSPGLSPSAALMVCSFPTRGAAEPEGCRNQAWELYLRGYHFTWHLPLKLMETLPQQHVLP